MPRCSNSPLSFPAPQRAYSLAAPHTVRQGATTCPRRRAPRAMHCSWPAPCALHWPAAAAALPAPASRRGRTCGRPPARRCRPPPLDGRAVYGSTGPDGKPGVRSQPPTRREKNGRAMARCGACVPQHCSVHRWRRVTARCHHACAHRYGAITDGVARCCRPSNGESTPSWRPQQPLSLGVPP